LYIRKKIFGGYGGERIEKGKENERTVEFEEACKTWEKSFRVFFSPSKMKRKKKVPILRPGEYDRGTRKE